MNFTSLINDVCCDARIKNGAIDLKDSEHVFVLQEYLEKYGINIDTVVEKTAKLFEAGRFPERQAYNKNGILVTFPTKEYRDRAVDKGTHFAHNPKKQQPNIFTAPAAVGGSDPESKIDTQTDTVQVDDELKSNNVDNTSTTSPEERTPEEKVIDAQVVGSMLSDTNVTATYSIREAKSCGFYNKGMLWYDAEGKLVGEQVYDDTHNQMVIKPTK